jgi:hypothetical protein
MTTEIDGHIQGIWAHHAKRRYAIKLQQKIDRAMESWIRIHETDWTPDLSEDEREKYNKLVKALIAKARKEGASSQSLTSEIVGTTDIMRKPIDLMRDTAEKNMESIAQQLPVWEWAEQIHGIGPLGIATIVAEAGDLSKYQTPAKLWKRLGYHVYEGCAGSTWKREKWRPRKLEAEEWIANPFSGQRYALMTQVATWLVNAQWIGAKKTGTDEGKPNGPYGEIYAARRAHTFKTQPEWTLMHRRRDALRIVMKRLLLDLWRVWNGQPAHTMLSADQGTRVTQSTAVGGGARDGQDITANHAARAAPRAKKSRAKVRA